MGSAAHGGRLAGGAAAAMAVFLIGTSASVAAKLDQYPLLGGQAARFAVAAVLLLALLSVRGELASARLTARVVLGLTVLGLVGIAAFNVFLVAAARYVDPALIGTVLAAAPVALAVLGPALQRRRPGLFVVVGCVLVTVGTVVGTGLGRAIELALVLCLGALICEVAFSVLAVPLIARLGTLRTTAYATCAATLVLTVAGLVIEGPARLLRSPTGIELACLVYMTVVIAVVANLLWYAALPRIGAEYAGLFYAFAPVGALAAGLLLHTSAPSTGELIGLGLVMLGLFVGLTPRPGRDPRVRKPRTPSPARAA